MQEIGNLGGTSSHALASLQAERIAGVRESAQAERSEAAGQAFEQLFATMLVKEMRQALPEGFFGKGEGADVFESWLDEHLGNALAERDVFGFAGLVKEDLMRLDAATMENAE
jgi:Rod binding domain-containing protein